MVVPLIIGVALIGVSTLFVADAVGTLLHWSSIAGSILGAALLFWNLEKENYLEIESPALSVVSYSAVSFLTGFLLFRLSEALISAASGLVALVSLTLVVLLLVNPGLVVRILAVGFEVLTSFLEGDN